MLQRAPISPQQLLAQRSRVSERDCIQFWRLAEAACEHAPGLAVETAGQFNLRALGLLGMAWLTSTSLREATRRLVRHYDLVSSLAVLGMQTEGELIWLQYHASAGGRGLHGRRNPGRAIGRAIGRAAAGGGTPAWP